MDREKLVQKREEVFGQIKANEEKLKEEGLSNEDRDSICTESDSLFDELHGLDKQIRFATRKEAADERFQFDREFSVVRRPGPSGNVLKYRRVSWSSPLDSETDVELKDGKEILDRDKLIMHRYEHGHDALTDEEKIASSQKFAGERMTMRFLALGGDLMSLSSAEMDALRKWQGDFKHTLENYHRVVDGGVSLGGGTPANITNISDFYVPTEIERGILYEMQYSGPFAGPEGGYGRWNTYPNGRKRQVNVNTSGKDTMAAYVPELTDVGLLKPAYRLQDLDFAVIGGLMPWSIQAETDSIENLESELRVNLGMAFGNRLNRDLSKNNTAAAAAAVEGLTIMATAGAASPAGTTPPPARVKRLATAQTITSDEIIDVKHLINKSYRNSARQFAFMADGTVTLQIEKMRVGTGDGAGGANRGEYLYQRATADGPPMIHGVPVVQNDGFDNFPSSGTGSNDIVGCMGDFFHFRIGMVRGITVQVLRELFAQSLQIGLLGHMRFGSFIPDRNAFMLVQNKAA